MFSKQMLFLTVFYKNILLIYRKKKYFNIF